MVEVNIPEIVAEVTDAYARYENALVNNDIAVLHELFWNSAHTLRYGFAENLHGFEQIAAFCSSRPSAGLARRLRNTEIMTYGRDFATVNTEFERDNVRPGRQSQTWVRTDAGWRIAAAHVSLIQAQNKEQ